MESKELIFSRPGIAKCCLKLSLVLAQTDDWQLLVEVEHASENWTNSPFSYELVNNIS